MGERFRLAVQAASPPTGVAELEVRSVAQAKPQRPAAACRVVQTLTASHRRSQQRRLHLIHRRNRLSPPFGPGLPLRRRLQRKAGGSRSVPVFAPDAREFAAQQGAGLQVGDELAQGPHFGVADAAHDVLGADLPGVIEARGLHQLLQCVQGAVMKVAHPLGLVGRHQGASAQGVLCGHAGGAARRHGRAWRPGST